jgi:hypothetical protein
MRKKDWPAMIAQPLVFANFRSPTILRPRPLSYQQRREGNDRFHLDLVRQLSCLVCPEREAIDPHHLKTGPARAERAFGRRATDRWVVPICRMHHGDLERLASICEPEWFAGFGIDNPAVVALALWNETRHAKRAKAYDIARLQRVLDAHKREAVRRLGAMHRAARG